MNDKEGLILNRDIVSNTIAEQLLDRIRNWILKTTPNCLIHPLGFCVVLLQKNDHDEWRFHVWPKGKRKITGMPGPIHTHNKVVDSKILAGELSNVIYSVVEVVKGGIPVYEVEYSGDRYLCGSTNVLARSGCRVQPKMISCQVIRTDESYTIPVHTFHQIVVSESFFAATVVCMHSASPGAIKVLGLDGYPDCIEIQRPRCSAIEAAKCTES